MFGGDSVQVRLVDTFKTKYLYILYILWESIFNTDGQRAPVGMIPERFCKKKCSNIFKTTISSSSTFLHQTMEWQVFVAPQLKGHPAVT